MALRILSGSLKGHTLKVPESSDLRPTSVLLRRKIFDARQSMENYIFCDLCAGTGAVAIEALSRGALKVFCSEPNSFLYKNLSKNFNELKSKLPSEEVGQLFATEKMTATRFLEKWKSSYQEYSVDQKLRTILFLDPPYQDHQLYTEVIEFLKQDLWFMGELWVESDFKKGIALEELKSILPSPHKVYQHSDHFIIFSKWS